MNKLRLCTILFIVLATKSIEAQESFLVFDSIQIVENEHTLTRQGSIGGVLDTISIQVLSNQYIKINNVSLSVRATSYGASNALSSNTMPFDESSRTVYDLRLDLNKINLISTPDFGKQIIGQSHALGRKSNNFGVTKNDGILLSEGSYDVVVKYSGYFDGSSGTDRSLNSRLELIYFSKE